MSHLADSGREARKKSVEKFWHRAIILVDMNAFFAAIEQHDHPAWRGQPLAVTNGEQGTCIITSSYEARAYGIKTGMRLKEGRERCPHLIQVPAHPERYAKVSQTIMAALEDITPDIEVFSVDEAFLDVTHCQSLWGSPEKIGQLARQKVFEASGLLCSIGVSGDKTTAKYAAKMQKPNGFTMIPPWEAKERLRTVPVTELCGIAEGIGNFLAKYGVYTCGDMEKLPIGILAKRFGNIGRRIWYMCQGEDPEPLQTKISAPKSMGHGKVMPPNTRDKRVILTYLQHMCEKLAARLRCHQLQAQYFFIGWRHQYIGWIGSNCKTIYPTNDGAALYKLGKTVLQNVWDGGPVCQIQVTATDPMQEKLQYDFFEQHNLKKEQVNTVMDSINQRFGEFCLAPALLLQRSQMPNVIAPAWKPSGHRQTI